MKHIVLAKVLLLALALLFVQAKYNPINPVKCDVATSSFNLEAEKLRKSFETLEFQDSLKQIFTMQLILPQVIEVCEGFQEQSPGAKPTTQGTDKQQNATPEKSCIASLTNCYLKVQDITENTNLVELLELLQSVTSTCGSFSLANHALLGASHSDHSATSCLFCQLLTTLAMNKVADKSQDIGVSFADHFCLLLPSQFTTACNTALSLLSPYLIQAATNKYDSDVICKNSGACSGKFSECHAHSPSIPQDYEFPTQSSSALLEQAQPESNDFQNFSSSLASTAWEWISSTVTRFTSSNLPLVDIDNDGFSTVANFRGYNWRGKDCDDFSSAIYPGRKSFDGVNNKAADHDCNGVFGINKETGKYYEEELCGESDRLGVIVIGDSAGAHFSIPPKYFNVSMWQQDTFKDFLELASNEMDLPQLSAITGHQQDEKNQVHSFYQRIVERNRCNKNDYQNIGQNGAWSQSLEIFKAIRRNQTHDHPQLVVFELVGNDLCSSQPSDAFETVPLKFKERILGIWNYLDTVLPKGSHMMVWGLVDGDLLYDTLKDRDHPLSIKYKHFYDFMNCLEINPCWGWLNTNSTIREATTKRAHELNNVYKEIIETTKFNNFDVAFFQMPIKEAIEQIVKDGHEAFEAIEPVDGFHPSQLANAYISEIMWNKLVEEKPEWIPGVNKNNQIIDEIFDSPSNIVLEQAY